MTAPLPRTWHGPEAGEVVVFANSLGTVQGMWDAQVSALAGSFRLLTFDLPGHVPGPVEPFTFDDMVTRTIEVLDSERVRGATLVGVSLGGALGIAVAARRPDLVGRLIAVNTPIRQASKDFWTDRAATVEREGLAGLVAGLRERWFPESSAASEVVVGQFAALDPGGYAAACRALADLEVTAAAAAVAAPTLVVSARDDPSVPPANSDELAATIPGAVLWPVIAGGHLLPVTRPGILTRLIEAFTASRPLAV